MWIRLCFFDVFEPLDSKNAFFLGKKVVPEFPNVDPEFPNVDPKFPNVDPEFPNVDPKVEAESRSKTNVGAKGGGKR